MPRSLFRWILDLLLALPVSVADRTSHDFACLKPRQIIVNDTAHELILHTVLYGYGLSSKQPVRPYSVVELDRLLDYYGPTDRPPASVEGYGGPRYWLTW